MKISPADFGKLVAKVMQNSHLATMRPVVEKELLHYDILFCLDQANLLDHLVFQGGTSLRLCHGSNRFSEDLDFAGGEDFTSEKLSNIKECIMDYIGNRYGLEISVREPKTLKQDPQYAELNISKWQIAIVTSPEQKHMPKQRIKIEVANIPSYTREALSLKQNYDFLPDGYEDTVIYTESLDEVMADKIISLPATQKYIRHRDIWDLTWLSQQGAKLNIDLVQNKIEDYQIKTFDTLLTNRIQSISKIVASNDFSAEMKRFLPTDIFDRTFGKTKFLSYLESSVIKLLETTHNQIYGAKTIETTFEL